MFLSLLTANLPTTACPSYLLRSEKYPPEARSCDACRPWSEGRGRGRRGGKTAPMPITRVLGFHHPAGKANQSCPHGGTSLTWRRRPGVELPKHPWMPGPVRPRRTDSHRFAPQEGVQMQRMKHPVGCEILLSIEAHCKLVSDPALPFPGPDFRSSTQTQSTLPAALQVAMATSPIPPAAWKPAQACPYQQPLSFQSGLM